jgi:molecular chaperone DnaK
VKRFMGRGLEDARADLASVPFPATETDHGVVQFEVRGRTWTPQQLSGLILQEVWRTASEALGEEAPRRAVARRPADQRRALLRDVERRGNAPVRASRRAQDDGAAVAPQSD